MNRSSLVKTLTWKGIYGPSAQNTAQISRNALASGLCGDRSEPWPLSFKTPRPAADESSELNRDFTFSLPIRSESDAGYSRIPFDVATKRFAA